jgi:hypothetical protein
MQQAARIVRLLLNDGCQGTGRGESQCTLTKMGLPMPMALLLILATGSWLRRRDLALLLILATGSWPRGHVLALLSLGHRGHRVAATSGLVDSHCSACDWNYPPLTGLLRCASFRARFLGVAFVLIRHLFFGASSVGVNW